MSRDNTIELKLVINGKEAVAQVNLTDDALKKLGANLRAVCNDAEITGNTIVDGFTRARNTIQGMREAWDGVKQIFGKPLQLSVQYDQYEAAMEVMLKSADAAKYRMKELEAFAAATPFQLNEVVALGMQLQSIQQYSIDTVKSLGDLAAASGKSMSQVFGAYAKLATGQIGEAKRMFQDVLISEKDWEKALNAKGLTETADNMMFVLNDILVDKGMSGMMDKMSERMVGKLSNFEDAITKMQRSLGDGIAAGMTPFVNTMTKGITALNEFSPALSGVIYGMGALTVSASFLNQTGLLPMIINKEKLIAALQASRLQFHLASMSGQTFAGSMTAAGVATKGFFASLGPVGWAVLGISALTTAVGALSEQSENAKRMNDEFALSLSQMSLDELIKQQAQLNEQIRAEKEARMAVYAPLVDNYFLLGQLKEVESAITKELELQEKLRASQIGNLRKQLDVELERTDKDRKLKVLEQQYAERLLIAKGNEQLLLDVEKWYKIEKSKIEGDAYKKSLNDYWQYADKLNSLRLQGMQDGLDKELKALEFWYEEQKRTIKKNDLELLDLAKKAKEEQIRLKYSGKIATPETMAEDQRQLNEINKKLLDDKNRAIQQSEETALAIIRSCNDREFSLRRNQAKATIADKQQLETALAAIDKEELERKKQLLTDQLSEIKTNTTLEKDERELKEQELLTAITIIEGQILDVKIAASNEAIDQAEREAEFRKQTMKQIIGDTGSLFGQMYSREQESTRREIDAERKKRTESIETERRKRIEHAVTQQEKDRINREYDARLKQMEEQYEQRQKEAGVEMFYMQQHMAAVQALINTYESATKAYAQGGAIFGPPLAAMITALGLAQVAMIESQEPPGYAAGGLISGGDQIIRVNEDGQEYVVNADATSRYINVLDAINNNRELRLPVTQSGDSELVSEIKILRAENKRLLTQQLKAFSRPHIIKVGIDKHETAAIVETAETLINKRKA